MKIMRHAMGKLSLGCIGVTEQNVKSWRRWHLCDRSTAAMNAALLARLRFSRRWNIPLALLSLEDMRL